MAEQPVRGPIPINAVIGRVRVTRVVSASEAGYIAHMREQSKVIADNMRRAVQHIDNATPDAILFGLEPIYDESQRLVPVDTGRLKRSGFTAARKRAGGATAEIGYGRFGRPFYALFVHERMDVRHAPPTQAKFLETAVMTKLGDFRRRVELYMRRLSSGCMISSRLTLRSLGGRRLLV